MLFPQSHQEEAVVTALGVITLVLLIKDAIAVNVNVSSPVLGTGCQQPGTRVLLPSSPVPDRWNGMTAIAGKS